MAEVCVLCNVLSCVPGFYSSGCAPGSVRDAVCLPCSNGPSVGPYNWTSGCAFECSPGYWLNETQCSACSVVSCSPGWYPSECGGANNSRCVACPIPPVNGPINWTDGCSYVCADGYFFRSDQECALCTDLICFPGYLKAQCTTHNDTECLACGEPTGQFAWIGGCDYVCVDGYYRSLAGNCTACSALDCSPGTYLAPCNASADAACVRCAEPVGSGFVWTSGCNHSCVEGQYWFDGTECQRCASNLSCDPGWSPSVCSQTLDSVCTPCVQTQGSFEWTVGCEFRCSEGFFLRDGRCLPCSSPVCLAGTYPVGCTNVSDAACANCNPPSGNFAWTQACDFVCGSGYFMQGGTCALCNVHIVCDPGFKPSACTEGNDVVCEPCGAPPDGSYVWTSGCDYSCAHGYFLNGSRCDRCSAGPCAAGTFMVDCTANSDSECLQCAAPSGAYRWTAGCAFECADGYFVDGAMCSRCSALTCLPGTYLKNCSRASDAVCSGCTNAPAAGYAWTAGCDFRCLEGYYRDPLSSCTRCNTRSCGVGTIHVACTANSDARCTPCISAMAAERFVWTDNACSFKCADGYYLLNSSFCERCSDLACGPGFYKVGCSTSTDSSCAQCSGGGAGVVWGVDCQFSCVDGFVLRSGQCQPVPITTPLVFAVVHSEVAMQNTVSEICADVISLTLAMSSALSTLSNGTVQYSTNITMLDGQPCVANVCPQCVAQNGRRLLSTVSISVVSQSTAPVVSAAVASIQPSSSSLKDALVQSLSSSALNVGTVASVVSTKAAYVVSEPVDYGFLYFCLLICSGSFVLCGICFVCVACCKRCCCDLQQDASKKEPCGGDFFSQNNARVSLNSGLAFRRRSKSRERVLSIGLL